MNRRIVSERSSIPACGIQIAEHRQVDDTGHDVIPNFEPDEIAPQRISAQVVACAVDWIYDPPAPATRLDVHAFFTQESVLWKCLTQYARDQFLALPVRCSDRGFFGLGLVNDTGLIMQREFNRLLLVP